MKLEKAILVVLLMLSVSFYAQQDPQYTHYMYNMNIVNPAYAGSQEAMEVNFLGRTQWVGIQGAPETLTFGIHSPIGKNVGLGLSIISDKLGPVKEQNVFADFSYTLKLADSKRLAFGLKGGFSFLDVNLPVLKLTNPGDRAFENRINRALPNFGAGVFYYTDKFYAGLSVPNILETLHFDNSNATLSKASEVAHYFLTGGYVFDLSRNLKLKPSFMFKAAKGAPTSLDLSLNALLNEKFEFGMSYRLDDSVSTLINFRASNNLRIGYAYDHTISNLGQFNSGSHELFLLFNFSFLNESIKSPRFF